MARRYKREENISERRKQRIREVLSRRQKDLTLVMDNIHDLHNVSAVMRSCDAFGLHEVQLLYSYNEMPEWSSDASSHGHKWLELKEHQSAQDMSLELKAQGYQLIGTGFTDKAIPLPEWDLSRPSAIILSNEHNGLSPDLEPHIDGLLYIPMVGMVQSFNVSVAASIILYEAWTQRQKKGLYDTSAFEPEAFEALYKNWCTR